MDPVMLPPTILSFSRNYGRFLYISLSSRGGRRLYGGYIYCCTPTGWVYGEPESCRTSHWGGRRADGSLEDKRRHRRSRWPHDASDVWITHMFVSEPSGTITVLPVKNLFIVNHLTLAAVGSCDQSWSFLHVGSNSLKWLENKIWVTHLAQIRAATTDYHCWFICRSFSRLFNNCLVPKCLVFSTTQTY